MPGWLKVILIVVAAFILVIIVGGFLAYRSFKTRAPALKAQMESTQREGTAFGAGKQPPDCIEEALRRSQSDRSFTGAIRTRMFAEACFKAATPSPSFCEKVPTGIIATAKWAAEECSRRGLAGDQACTQVFTATGDYCHPQR
jgi:hypothetical protein